jgi:stage II sporulation protein D
MRSCLIQLWLLSVWLGVLPAQAAPLADTLRIRVLEQARPRQVEVYSPEGDLRLLVNDRVLGTLRAGETAAMLVREGTVHIRQQQGSLGAAVLHLKPAGGHTFVLKTTDDGRAVARTYSGSLEVFVDPQHPTVLQLVNHVALEEYVASVVATEYGLDDLEGSKAMAVLVRTYALNAHRKYGNTYDHVDHSLSQVYRGAERITPRSREATRLTEGEVLTFRDVLIEAVYSSSSGGHTASNEDVWNAAPRPYLRGRPDPYALQAPNAAWESRLPRPALLQVLGQHYGGRVTGFRIHDRSRDGRARTIALTLGTGATRTVNANDFRLVISRHFGAQRFKSTLFNMRLEGDTYVFSGKGFGHGVGLSQWGAHEMARQGHSYRDILAYYFQGVTLERLPALLTRRNPSAASPAPAHALTERVQTLFARHTVDHTRSAPASAPPAEAVPPPVRLKPLPPASLPERRIGW